MLGDRGDHKTVLEFYDQGAGRFSRAQINTYASRHDNLAALSPLLYVERILADRPRGANALFLDLCCGTGVCSIYPAKLGYRVVGVDLSPALIDEARWLSSVNEVSDNCNFEVMEALEYLRSTDAQFDVIFIRGSLYYLGVEEALPLIVRHLRPGGSFISIETNGSNFIMNTIRRVMHCFKGHRDARTLDGLLRKAAFAKMASYFEHSEVRFFDCIALGFILFPRNNTLRRSFHNVAQKLDYFLLNTLGACDLAFKMVFKGEISSERQGQERELPSKSGRAYTPVN